MGVVAHIQGEESPAKKSPKQPKDRGRDRRHRGVLQLQPKETHKRKETKPQQAPCAPQPSPIFLLRNIGASPCSLSPPLSSQQRHLRVRAGRRKQQTRSTDRHKPKKLERQRERESQRQRETERQQENEEHVHPTTQLNRAGDSQRQTANSSRRSWRQTEEPAPGDPRHETLREETQQQTNKQKRTHACWWR